MTFDEGSVSGDAQCYDVVIIDDNLVEDNEVFFVTVTSPEPALLGSTLSRATVTINPDPADGKDNDIIVSAMESVDVKFFANM